MFSAGPPLSPFRPDLFGPEAHPGVETQMLKPSPKPTAAPAPNQIQATPQHTHGPAPCLTPQVGRVLSCSLVPMAPTAAPAPDQIQAAPQKTYGHLPARLRFGVSLFVFGVSLARPPPHWGSFVLTLRTFAPPARNLFKPFVVLSAGGLVALF